MKRIVLAVIGAGLLAGCGLRGDLERPAPLWGPEKAKWEAEAAARAAAEKAAAEEKARRDGTPQPITPAPAPRGP
jgi:hypothetical protein